MKKPLLIPACLLLSVSACAATPQGQQSQARALQRPSPCQGQAPQRDIWPNGTLLWGSARKVAKDETSTVLASVDLTRARRGGHVLEGVRLQEGRLMAPPQAPEGLDGTILLGSGSDGQPVEVALCGAEPDANDPSMAWHRIELWDAESAAWKNPCIATAQVPSPRALAVAGVWDGSGARHDVPGKFTFACENGAIAKCIEWNYKPWASKDGEPLREMHQACTRMARANYCGNGRSHTREHTAIDIYDALGVLTRTTQSSAAWRPEMASFEAAWTPEGAACLARTRDGQAIQTVLEECPNRFDMGALNLGEGDQCTLSRKGAGADTALLRNRSYGKASPAPLSLTAIPTATSPGL